MMRYTSSRLIKNLDILFDSKIKLDVYLNNIILQVHKQLRFNNGIDLTDKYTLKFLYYFLVCLTCEYSSIQSSYQSGHKSKLERAQQKY